MTATRVNRLPQQGGHTKLHCRTGLGPKVPPKIRIEVLVAEHRARAFGEVIERLVDTRPLGDGQILVFSIPEAVPVGTGERGTEAVQHRSNN